MQSRDVCRAALSVTLAWVVSAIPACVPRLTPDQRDVKRVLSDYTSALKRADFSSAYALLSRASQEQITLAEFAGGWSKALKSFDIASYSIPHISILNLNQGDYATAVLRRVNYMHETGKREESRHDYHLRKESGSWRILRTSELDVRLERLLAEGDSVGATRLAAICVRIDPLVAKTPGEYIDARRAESKQKTAITWTSQPAPRGKPKSPPAGIALKITKTTFDGYSFVVGYTVTNGSQRPVSDVEVRVVFRRPGAKEILQERSDHPVPFTATLQPGYSKTGKVSYFRDDEKMRKVVADLYLSVDESDWRLVQGDIELSIPRVADVVRFEVTSTSFERGMAATLADYIYTARLDYRISNTAAGPLDYLAMRVVWKSPSTGEVVDEALESVVWSGGTPMAPGETRSGYVTCGKGSTASLMARTADIYLARFYDEYELVKSGVSIRQR